MSYLEGVIGEVEEARQGRTEQPLLFLRMHVAQYQLLLGQLKACQEACEAGKATLDLLNDVRWLPLSTLTPCMLPRHNNSTLYFCCKLGGANRCDVAGASRCDAGIPGSNGAPR